MLTLTSALQWWAKSRPDTVAISLAGETVTYSEWVPWIERVAARLEELGVKPGERINTCGANSLEYCTLTFAAMRAGAIIAPLNTRYTDYELCEIVADHSPSLIFADEDQAGKFAAVDVRILGWNEVSSLRHASGGTVRHDPDPDACVVIISTSGSTAKPKGVMFSHRTMLGYAQANAMEESALRNGGGVIVVAPLATSAGMVQLVHYTALGCTLYFEPSFDAKRFLNVLVDGKIVSFGGAPAFFERIAALPEFKDADLSHLEVVTVGGARVTTELFDAWAAKGKIIRQIYGQTEAGGNSTIMPASLAAQYPEKCGWGGIFTHHRIVDAKGNDLPPDTEGEILIRGPGMMLGYWNNPQATAETIRDGWLYSGDLGKMDERGLITFVDRIKDIIVSGGLNISAAEVERAVLEFPGIEEVAVISAPDPKFQETPLAIVYSSTEINVEELINHCNARLADFKVPRYVAVRDTPLPRLATQKIAKPALRTEYAEAHLDLPRVR
ncbi:MAG: class I adenylate-forming enzyme family protein [Sphingomonadaceae bacterium]